MTHDLAASYALCRQLASAASSNFYLAFWLLPADKHEAMCALYAFLRHGDDLCDGDDPLEVRRAALAAWRESLARALDGTFDHGLLPALADTVARYDIPPEYLYHVLDGFEFDLGRVRCETFADLDRYCFQVAGAVGYCCLHIWGFSDDAAFAPARACGLAFQLTNILRDLAEDAARDRVYLPLNELRRFDYSVGDLQQGIRDERFRRLLEFQIDRAEASYGEAQELVEYLTPEGRRVWIVMFETYRHLLDEIRRRGPDLLSSRTEVGFWTRIWIAAGALWRSGGGSGKRQVASSKESEL